MGVIPPLASPRPPLDWLGPLTPVRCQVLRSEPAVQRLRALLMICAGLCLPVAASATETVRISGTGSGVGGMKLLGDAFMAANPDVKVDVLPAPGSSGGISALIAGALEVAVSNRPPNDKETAQARLTVSEYARTAFVIAVHRNVGVTALSAAELAALYADGPAKFPNGARARPVLRLTDATDTRLLKSFGPEVATAIELASKRRGLLYADTDSEAADMIEKVSGAFGGSTLAQIASERRPLVALVIADKAPTHANLASDLYPQYKSLFLIASASPSPATRRFIAYVGSAAAQALLSAHGHLPR